MTWRWIEEMEGEVPEISGHDLVGTALAHPGKVATGQTKPDPLRIHLLLRPTRRRRGGTSGDQPVMACWRSTSEETRAMR